MASSGGSYTLDRGESGERDANAPFARRQGGGYRGIYDLANPDRSRFMIATGESSALFSKHYGDLAPLWNDVKYIEIAGTHDELAARGLPELVFAP
jgi:penicillin amidase